MYSAIFIEIELGLQREFFFVGFMDMIMKLSKVFFFK